ncbi:hypothetical protein BBJ28_00014653 [Nothophytophthora sp. Chile5]|nr:hypothetical protein BBJ28_00014653 [Nothophytophthora sp. Chile5]
MTGAVWTVVTVPWSSLKLLELAIRWSASMAEASEPKSSPPLWADDLFPATKKDWGPSCSCEDLTDGSDSEIFGGDEDDDDWSSEEEEDLDGFSVGSDGFVDFWGDRWLWKLNTDDDESQGGEKAGLQHGEVAGWSSYSAQRLASYMMPSMDLNTNGAVDVWVDRYGSSGFQFHYVTTAAHQLDACDDLAAVELLPSPSGHFIVTL